MVVTLYGVLAYAGFRIARRAADRFIQLASVAITVWLIGQAAMNMGYVVGLLPVTGVQLPLISAGGTSLVLTLFIVGLLARFARAEPAAIEDAAHPAARPPGPPPAAGAGRGGRAGPAAPPPAGRARAAAARPARPLAADRPIPAASAAGGRVRRQPPSGAPRRPGGAR